MIDKSRLSQAWNMHLAENEHVNVLSGEDFECWPEYCLDSIIDEYNKLLWKENPHNAWNPAHDPECAECKWHRRYP